jgi:hypothetical protein
MIMLDLTPGHRPLSTSMQASANDHADAYMLGGHSVDADGDAGWD